MFSTSCVQEIKPKTRYLVKSIKNNVENIVLGPQDLQVGDTVRVGNIINYTDRNRNEKYDNGEENLKYKEVIPDNLDTGKQTHDYGHTYNFIESVEEAVIKEIK